MLNGLSRGEIFGADSADSACKRLFMSTFENAEAEKSNIILARILQVLNYFDE